MPGIADPVSYTHLDVYKRQIQSIEIDHLTEDSAVLSLVLTDEGDVGQLSVQLIGAGYAVSFSPLAAKEHTHVE